MTLTRQLTVMCLLVLFSAQCLAELPKPPKGIRVYEIGNAADFNLPDIDGETHKLSAERGHWVFLHFWASWCGPCRKEMPQIQILSQRFSDDELSIMMINTAEDEDTIFSFLASIDVEVNPLLDRDGTVTEVWKPRGLPTTFLIDPDGKVRYQAIGGREWSNPVYIDFLTRITTYK